PFVSIPRRRSGGAPAALVIDVAVVEYSPEDDATSTSPCNWLIVENGWPCGSASRRNLPAVPSAAMRLSCPFSGAVGGGQEPERGSRTPNAVRNASSAHATAIGSSGRPCRSWMVSVPDSLSPSPGVQAPDSGAPTLVVAEYTKYSGTGRTGAPSVRPSMNDAYNRARRKWTCGWIRNTLAAVASGWPLGMRIRSPPPLTVSTPGQGA